LNVLRNDLGYFVPDPQIVNAKDFGVPQNRERIYIVGFHPSLNIENFNYPKPTNKNSTFADVKEENIVETKYYLSTQYLQTLINHKARHENKGNGFGYEIINFLGVPFGRALRYNLFARSSQKGFPLQSLTQNAA
jgi:DNA (cytosine-5)-methyltransferase 1